MVSAKKIQWLGSESEAILVALQDITEHKRIEAELAQLLIREREARLRVADDRPVLPGHQDVTQLVRGRETLAPAPGPGSC